MVMTSDNQYDINGGGWTLKGERASSHLSNKTTSTATNDIGTASNIKQDKKTLGIIGLGKMGGNLTLQALEKGINVVGKAQSDKPELQKAGARIVSGENYDSFVKYLGAPPRVVYLSLPAGPTVDSVLNGLVPCLGRGDVIMDGGNSFYLDSIEREKRVWEESGIYFLDCGTSGGLEGARHGACFMVGGKDEGVKIAEPILKDLSVPDGYLHTGSPGSGHFTKLVHNGIEFGMLQAIGEGVSLLHGSSFDLNLQLIFKNWSHGSVIRGWLVELMEKGLEELQSRDEKQENRKGMEIIQSYVEDTGEVNWLVQDAINKEIPIPVISQSVMELFKSRAKDSYTYKSIAIMRHGFGGHPFGRDEHIIKERHTSRIQKI